MARGNLEGTRKRSQTKEAERKSLIVTRMPLARADSPHGVSKVSTGKRVRQTSYEIRLQFYMRKNFPTIRILER